jgi:hypothetical protein
VRMEAYNGYQELPNYKGPNGVPREVHVSFSRHRRGFDEVKGVRSKRRSSPLRLEVGT